MVGALASVHLQKFSKHQDAIITRMSVTTRTHSPTGINYKYELFRVLDGGGTEAAGNNCQGQGLGIERELSGIYDDWKIARP